MRSIRRITMLVVAIALTAAAIAAPAGATTGFDTETHSANPGTLEFSKSQLTFSFGGGATETACGVPGFEVATDAPTYVVMSTALADAECSGSNVMKMNGCRLTFAPEGKFGIGPPGCGPVTVSSGCIMKLQAQSGLGAIYTNEGSGAGRNVRVTAQAEGVEYSCGGTEYENGLISGEWTVTSRDAEGNAQGLWVDKELTMSRLCKVSGETCSAANQYPAETWLQGSATNAAIASTFPFGTVKIKCSESSFEGLASVVTTWSLAGCKVGISGEPSCTASDEYLPARASLTQGSGSNGIVSLPSWFGWYVQCENPVVQCSYSFTPVLDLEAGNPAKLIASKEPMAEYGAFCPGEGQTFTGTYTIDAPKPLYVGKG